MSNKKIDDRWEPLSVEPFRFSAEGDSLEGVYIGSDEIVLSDGSPVQRYKIFINGVVYGVLATTILQQALASVAEGDLVRIVYLGEVKNAKGRRMRAFQVFRQKK